MVLSIVGIDYSFDFSPLVTINVLSAAAGTAVVTRDCSDPRAHDRVAPPTYRLLARALVGMAPIGFVLMSSSLRWCR